MNANNAAKRFPVGGPLPGRKRLTPEARATHCNITLDAGTIERAKALGGGNLSRGIRAAFTPKPDGETT